MAGTLILEAIVVLLALPVVGAVGGGLTAWSMAYLIGFAVLLVLLAGVQGRPWAIWVNLGVQVVLIAGFVVYPGVGFIGVVFAVVWVLIAYLRAEVLRRQRQRPAARPAAARRTDRRLGTLCAVTERTLVLIKPDGVERRLVGEILSRIERKGLTIAALELKNVSDELARAHYAEHDGKPFFGSLLEFITSGPVVAAILEGPRRSRRSASSPAAPTRSRRPRPAPSAATSAWRRSSTWCTGRIRPSPPSARSRSGSPAV